MRAFGTIDPKQHAIEGGGYALHLTNRGYGYAERMNVVRQQGKELAVEIGVIPTIDAASSSTGQPVPESGQPGAGTGVPAPVATVAPAAPAPQASQQSSPPTDVKGAPPRPPGPEFGQPDEGTGSPLAAYAVGDTGLTLACVTLRVSEDVSSEAVTVLQRRVAIEILELGKGIYENKLRVRSETGFGGWMNIKSNASNLSQLSMNWD